jgi:hypothetical protein
MIAGDRSPDDVPIRIESYLSFTLYFIVSQKYKKNLAPRGIKVFKNFVRLITNAENDNIG